MLNVHHNDACELLRKQVRVPMIDDLQDEADQRGLNIRHVYPGHDSYLESNPHSAFEPCDAVAEGERPTRVVGEDALDEVIAHTALLQQLR